MRYSIIIPVFNKADLTKQCLDALPATIADAGEGEVLVVDNASSDHTERVLRAYPWIRVIRNATNLGFAGANNQAAAEAQGEFLVLLNNDTLPWAGWLASMLHHAEHEGVGAVGARLLYPDKRCQHGGVVVIGNPFGRQESQPFHYNYIVPFDDEDVRRTQDFQIVTGACLVTPRALYARLGGLDESYWNGYEDVDYCLKVRREGLRVVYDADAVLYHFESQSGIQRFRKTAWNTELLERRWRGTMHYDALEKNLARGLVRHPNRSARLGLNSFIMATPPVNVIVHAQEPWVSREAFEAAVRANHVPIAAVHWATSDDALAVARNAMRVRGLRYAAFVHGGADPKRGWLDELVRQVTSTPTTVAATYAPGLPRAENVTTLAPDGRCMLFNLMVIPQHMELEAFETLGGSLADLALRLIPHGYGTRCAALDLVTLPALPADAVFESVHGRSISTLTTSDSREIERIMAARPRRARELVSIVTLSWNAPEFTRTALASIRKHTSEPYEVIVVDNGSDQATLDMLASLDDPHVRVVYNATNRGFGGGNNDGIAAARGAYVVVLNNDVVVTDGWLDALLEPFDRMPSVGVTAPRSNKIVGDQEVVDASYRDLEGMHAYARERRRVHAQRGYVTDRAIGFCLCIDRRVIDQIGGFDERFRMGNFEDDDFSIRVRAAGYEIYVCDDCFIHHFGSQSFKANNVDHGLTMRENWARFAQKWGYPSAFPEQGYDPRKAIAGGFDRERHYAPLPGRRDATSPVDRQPAICVQFALVVRDEATWSQAAEFSRRYLQAFDSANPVSLAIATLGSPDAATIAKRLVRTLEKLGIAEAACADVVVSDEDDVQGWRDRLVAQSVIDASGIEDRSPSALRRLLKDAVA